MKPKSSCRWFTAITCGLLAVGFLGLAIYCGYAFDPKSVDLYLQKELALINGSLTYESWRAPTVELFFEIFMFNWTNADKFPHEKPHLVQLGPYRFKEHREHIDVTWNQTEHTLGYRTYRNWTFDEATSVGSLDDVITTVNFLTATAVKKRKVKRDLWTNIGNMLKKGGENFIISTNFGDIGVTKTARELLFEGYSNTLLALNQVFPLDDPEAPRPDKFGWFYQRNNTNITDGYMEVTTGEAIGTLPGQIVRWNHEDRLKYYKGQCSRLSGSAGEFLPRNLTEHSDLMMFIPDLCRTVVMPYMHSGEYEGLKYLKYGISPSSFDYSSTASSDNTCFCNGPCEWGGVMNVTACRYNAPTFISLPHFLHGDSRLWEPFTGLQPDPEQHSFYFAVEPKMGIPLDVAARFQVNVYLEPDNGIFSIYSKLKEKLLFPVFWVQQRVQVDETVVSKLRWFYRILDWGAIICVGSALFFAILATVATCCCTERPEFTKPGERWWRMENIRKKARMAKAWTQFRGRKVQGTNPIRMRGRDVSKSKAEEEIAKEAAATPLMS